MYMRATVLEMNSGVLTSLQCYTVVPLKCHFGVSLSDPFPTITHDHTRSPQHPHTHTHTHNHTCACALTRPSLPPLFRTTAVSFSQRHFQMYFPSFLAFFYPYIIYIYIRSRMYSRSEKITLIIT